MTSSRVVDRHRFDADSDPYPTPSYTQVGKLKFCFDFNFTAITVYVVLSFSPVSYVSTIVAYRYLRKQKILRKLPYFRKMTKKNNIFL
jgi:hypothetical protein